MNKNAKLLVAGGLLSTLGVGAALADYTIYEDPAFPSVLFFEFEGPEPAAAEAGSAPVATVITAPGSSSLGSPTPVGTPVVSNSGSSASSPSGVIENRVNEIGQNGPAVVIQNEVDDAVLDSVDLR